MTTALKPTTFPVIFAAPSGAGKTTIAKRLLESRDDVEFSISATTRDPRPGEQDGVDYHFRSPDEFRRMIDAGDLLEWAEVHGGYYGTLASSLEHARQRDHFLMLDIDVQGSRQVKAMVPDAVSIFVLPPSGDVLAGRLIGRGSEDEDRRTRRLTAAREELRAAAEFDFIVVNDDLDRAVAAVNTILDSESRRRSRLAGLEPLIDSLIAEVNRVLGVVE